MISRSLLFILAVFLVVKSMGQMMEHDKFIIKVFDVGQGDAILIRTPKDYLIVIDGGPDYEADRYMDKEFFLNSCRIDLIILTHPHQDHIKGLNRLLERCAVKKVIFNPVEYDSYEYEKWLKNVENTEVLQLEAGDVFMAGGIRFVVVWPKEIGKDSNNINNASVSVLMDHGEFEALFLGDLEKEASVEIDRELLLRYIDGPLEIYKVPHHGSKDSHNLELIDLLSPEMCIIPVGEDNKFKHPDETTLTDIENSGCILRRTDEEGTIEVLIN